MSTINTTLSLSQSPSGLRINANALRAAEGAGFNSSIASVGSSDETITLGDIVIPQQVAVAPQ